MALEMNGGTAHILVVDDLPENRKLLMDLLTVEGIEVTQARDGVEAVEKATKEKYKLIIMDVEMPHLGGISATKMIRELGVDSLIVGFSGSSGNNTARDCLESGMTRFFEKPMDLRKLLNYVKENVI